MQQGTRIKVYYEDTDALGIVYYANYLRYLERARTDYVEASGKPIQQWNREGFKIAVYKVEITFLKPARLGDTLEVVSTVVAKTEVSRKLKQLIKLNGEVVTEALVHLVCLDDQLELRDFPPGILD